MKRQPWRQRPHPSAPMDHVSPALPPLGAGGGGGGSRGQEFSFGSAACACSSGPPAWGGGGALYFPLSHSFCVRGRDGLCSFFFSASETGQWGKALLRA